MSGSLVLVVDDEPSLRETLSFILEMEGFEVALAVDGVDALEAVRARRPRVVLLDVMLPRRDGFEVCREIKADERLAGTKVVMVTALGQRRDREQGFAAGADAFLAKPFDDEELLALVRSFAGDAA